MFNFIYIVFSFMLNCFWSDNICTYCWTLFYFLERTKWSEKLTHAYQNGFLMIALPLASGLVLTFASETAVRSSLRHTGGALWVSFVLYKTVKEAPLKLKWTVHTCKCFKTNQEVCIFWPDTHEGFSSIVCALSWEDSFCGKSVGGGWCNCVCVYVH